MALRLVGLLLACCALLAAAQDASAQPVASEDDADWGEHGPPRHGVGRKDKRNAMDGPRFAGRNRRKRKSWAQTFGMGSSSTGPDEPPKPWMVPKLEVTETLVGVFVIMAGGLVMGLNM